MYRAWQELNITIEHQLLSTYLAENGHARTSYGYNIG